MSKSKALKVFICMLSIVLCLMAIISGYGIGKRSVYPVAYSDYIIKYAHKNDLDVFLVMAVIKQESNFVPEASSPYAQGLMQLTKETAAWNAKQMGLSDYDYIDPETNIKIGCHYLKYLIDRYENIDTALAAYNGGMGNVDKWLNDPDCSLDGKTLYYIPFPETRGYIEKVNKYWKNYKSLYSNIENSGLQFM